MTEAELQKAVIDLAHLLGYVVHHDRPARTAKGWRTAVQGDAGFVDLVLARGRIDRREPRLIFAELKSEQGEVEPEQERWLAVLNSTGHGVCCVETYVWWPFNWKSGEIEAVLR